MISAAACDFHEICSIELEPRLWGICRQRFRDNPHVHLRLGDRAALLPELLACIAEPCVFWLDAHYSGARTAMGSTETPSLKELYAILNHPVKQHAGAPSCPMHREMAQALQNVRLLCPGATLLRNGQVCEECIERQSLLPALKHRCYRNSFPATAAVATMWSVHRTVRTGRQMVDMHIAPSQFVRHKFDEGGLPANARPRVV